MVGRQQRRRRCSDCCLLQLYQKQSLSPILLWCKFIGKNLLIHIFHDFFFFPMQISMEKIPLKSDDCLLLHHLHLLLGFWLCLGKTLLDFSRVESNLGNVAPCLVLLSGPLDFYFTTQSRLMS